MANAQHFHKSTPLWLRKGLMTLLMFLLSLMLLACGSDGKDGQNGAPGETGPVAPSAPEVSTNATALMVTINSVEINSTAVVNFTVIDQKGLPVVNLSGPRFSLAKLIPGSHGNNSAWQSYINTTEDADGNGPGTETTIQATQDRTGTLTNNQDGSYSYTFSNNISEITSPIAVTYQPEFSHRLAIQISGNEQPVTNVIYDWRPADGATSDIFRREIVKTQSCNTCHDGLALHGGGRVESQMCVTCHNPGSVDANSGNTVDYTVMIHKIHRGEQLPSVVAGNEYAIWGFRDTKHDYSEVTLPMDIRNCSKCHDSSDTQTPNAGNWQSMPTIEACGSCHDDIDFALGKSGGHAGGIMTDNSECSVCHRAGGFVGSIADSHQISRQVATSKFQFNILSVTNTAPSEFPKVTFSITNPEAGDAAYDILNDAEFTAGGGASRIAVDIAWSTTEYNNEGTGALVANALSLNPLTSAFDNGDGSFTVTSTTAIPAGQTGSGSVALEGHPALDLDNDGSFTDRVPVKTVVSYFTITDFSAIARRDVVTIEKCQTCHVNLSLHGDNRNDNIPACLMCHNPSATDINRRPASPADGLKEQSVDFKHMIHAIHASGKRENPFIVYGFGNSKHDFSTVTYPGKLNNCQACHVADSYQLPLKQQVQGTTIDSGASLAARADDLKVTPTAAVCSSCHDDPLSKAHMLQNGGASFSTSQAEIDNFDVVETCVFCHGDGALSDVKVVHGVK